MENMNTTSPNETVDPAVTDMATIIFKYGLPGFESLTQFTLSDVPEFPPFQTLTSLEEPNFSLLVLGLSVLNIENELEVLMKELKLKGVNQEENDIFLILKLDHKNKVFTANIKAPVIVTKDDSQGYQIILDNPGLPVDFLLNKV